MTTSRTADWPFVCTAKMEPSCSEYGHQTYCLWEANQTAPKIRHMPAVVKFLGFCMIDPDDTPGRRLTRARHCLGLGQKRMARMIGIDPNIVWRLEKETCEKREEYLRNILMFLEAEAQRRADASG